MNFNLFKKIFLLFIIFFCFNNKTSVDELKIIDSELKDLNYFSPENSSIIKCIFYSNSDENLIEKSIIKSLSIGNQISFSKTNNEINKEIIINSILNFNFLFYFIFSEDKEHFSWKLYDLTNNFLFIKGKKYKKNADNKNENLIRNICIDIWKELFGDVITPYQSQLIFISKQQTIKNNHRSQSTKVLYTYPFLDNFNGTIFSTNRNFIDIKILNTKPINAFVFSEITEKNVRLAKLTQSGIFSPLIDIKGTLSSLLINNDGVWYINNGNIFRYSYNNLKNKFFHQKIDEFNFSKNALTAKIITGPNNSLLVAQNFKIYLVDYSILKGIEKDFIKINNFKNITPKNINALNVSFSIEVPNVIITSEKINNYYQIVSYDILNDYKRTILTKGIYNKLDPAISPCGNYIAYIAEKENKETKLIEKNIEIVNLYTGKIIEIVKNGLFASPIWKIIK